MAFSIKGLKAIATLAPVGDGVPPPVLAHYSSPDALTTIRVANYFLPAIDMLPMNSILFITSATGTTPVHHIAYVNQNTGTAIDITDGLQVTATDTD